MADIKIYLDKDRTVESAVNKYLECRDGIVEMYTYSSDSGHGPTTRLYYCQNTKHAQCSIIRQIRTPDLWVEEEMSFDTDSFKFLEALIRGKTDAFGGGYTKIRDYSTRFQ